MAFVCEKTACVAYSEVHGEYLFGDSFHHNGTRVFRIVSVTRENPRGDKVHYTIFGYDQWFDRDSGVSTMISTSTAYHGYDGVTMEGR